MQPSLLQVITSKSQIQKNSETPKPEIRYVLKENRQRQESQSNLLAEQKKDTASQSPKIDPKIDPKNQPKQTAEQKKETTSKQRRVDPKKETPTRQQKVDPKNPAPQADEYSYLKFLTSEYQVMSPPIPVFRLVLQKKNTTETRFSEI